MRGYKRVAIFALIPLCLYARRRARTRARRLTHGPTCVVIMADDRATATWECTATPRSRRRTSTEFAGQSVRLKNFYVSPVCSPTRASLLTGRYNYPHRRGGHLPGPGDDASRRGHAGRNAGRGRAIGPASSANGTSATTRPCGRSTRDFEAVACAQRGRHRPAVRPAGRQQLFRPDLAGQWQARAVQGLLQRHFRQGRHRFHRSSSRRPSLLRLPRLQLPARTARGSRARTGDVQGDEPRAQGRFPSSASRSRRLSRRPPRRSRGFMP